MFNTLKVKVLLNILLAIISYFRDLSFKVKLK